MSLLEIIYVISFQALFFAILVALKKQKNQPDWLLLFFFLVCFFMPQIGNLTLGRKLAYADFFFLGIPLAYLLLPLFYGYIESHRRKINWRDSIHLLPALVVLLVLAQIYYRLPHAEKLLFLRQSHEVRIPISIELMHFGLEIVVIPFYAYLSWRSLQKHEEYTLMRFSYRDAISLSWLNRFVWFFGLLGIAFIVTHIIELVNTQLKPIDVLGIPVLLSSIGVIYLGIYGIRNNIAFSELDQELAYEKSDTDAEDDTPAPLPPKKQLEATQAAVYRTQLLQCMVTSKPYLNSKLSLRDLAARAEIPYYHLSTLLNQHLETTFYDFVNEYRVEEFISLRQDAQNDHFTLLSLAYDAGFNSKSSFYSIFKKQKGISPTDYFATEEVPIS